MMALLYYVGAEEIVKSFHPLAEEPLRKRQTISLIFLKKKVNGPKS